MDYYVCSEMQFGGGSCHLGASELVYVVGWLTGFCVLGVFTEIFFGTDLSIVLISFIYVNCQWLLVMFFAHVVDICGLLSLLLLLLLLLMLLLR